MPLNRFCFLVLVVMIIAACEPLAPEPNSQVIVVITNTPTISPSATPTPLLLTLPPTQTPTPTNTPTQVANPSPTIAPCASSRGSLLDLEFESTIVGEPVPYRMYLPPCFYDTFRRYPYVILFHGSNYDQTQWTTGLGIHELMDASLQDPTSGITPMVLVMPYGGDPQELNIFDEGASWEDIVLYELIPDVESKFCVWNEPEGRAIGGISRGGFWAVSIGLRYPDFFTSVGGHSPFFDEDNAPPSHNPLNLAASLRGPVSLRIYVDHARDDSGAANTQRFSATLRNRNVIHTYEISATGSHDNEYWASQVLDYLEFYSGAWPQNVAELPPCS